MSRCSSLLRRGAESPSSTALSRWRRDPQGAPSPPAAIASSAQRASEGAEVTRDVAEKLSHPLESRSQSRIADLDREHRILKRPERRVGSRGGGGGGLDNGGGVG